MGEKSRSKGWCGWLLVLVIVALIVGAIVIAIKKKQSDNNSDDDAAPVPGPPGAISQNYADALKIALQFFDVQKCTFLSL